jgi:phosphoribosylamine-glycine ligase
MTEPLPPAVGPEYGLEPLKDRTRIQPPLTSRNPVSTVDYQTGSEFGGVDGVVQPAPHKPTASERRMMVMAIDPTDDGTRDDGVRAPELEGF